MKQKDRTQAALVRSYARAAGISHRSAQRHRASNAEGWKRFASGEGAPVRPHQERVASELPPPPADDGELTEPGKMERVAWAMWKSASDEWKRLSESRADPLAVASLALAVSRLRQDYAKARQAREAAQVASRELVTISEWSEAFQCLRQLFDLLRGAPSEIALNANPAAPAQAREAIQKWLTERFQPQAEEIVRRYS